MASEIKRLFDTVRDEQLTCRQELLTLKADDSVARTVCIMTHSRRIASARTRLQELIGNSAVDRVDEIIESVDHLFNAKREQYEMQSHQKAGV